MVIEKDFFGNIRRCHSVSSFKDLGIKNSLNVKNRNSFPDGSSIYLFYDNTVLEKF